jgi:hypothetical protein
MEVLSWGMQPHNLVADFVRSLNRNATPSLDRRGRRAGPGSRRQFLLQGQGAGYRQQHDWVVCSAVSPLRDNFVQAQSKREAT